MLREYKTVKQLKEEVPGARLYILISQDNTKMLNLHCASPEPEGRWCLLGIID